MPLLDLCPEFGPNLLLFQVNGHFIGSLHCVRQISCTQIATTASMCSVCERWIWSVCFHVRTLLKISVCARHSTLCQPTVGWFNLRPRYRNRVRRTSIPRLPCYCRLDYKVRYRTACWMSTCVVGNSFEVAGGCFSVERPLTLRKLQLKFGMIIVPFVLCFRRTAAARRRKRKVLYVCLSRYSFSCVVKSCGAWQWASPRVSEVCTGCSRVQEESVCLGSGEKLLVATWVEWGLARCHLALHCFVLVGFVVVRSVLHAAVSESRRWYVHYPHATWRCRLSTRRVSFISLANTWQIRAGGHLLR
jgi:hypothetical protein